MSEKANEIMNQQTRQGAGYYDVYYQKNWSANIKKILDPALFELL